ncbi:hypothetical protein psal_cds_137 [Pandoravirus salinus]|uniref:Uncharacterized protein n=1 Tax=Pandoravirus salinus TaxID=1349410 RepID=S4W0I5_9VIRU|nr:hypothetical protein psal_cds_137 [Pandoravirus salinus]AGO83595.1 hypothetical protein psal_cds_137 [Pandoravirus salinus]
MRVRRAGNDDDNHALTTAVSGLRVAASLAPDAGFDAAARVLRAAREKSHRDGRLRLYLVDQADPLPATCGGGDRVAVMTLAAVRQRWPRLFDSNDDKSSSARATDAPEAVRLLTRETAETDLVVVSRLCLGEAALDAEFGPRDDPIVERVRALVAGMAASA